VSLSARASIRFNLEFDSNEIDESDSHLEKHDEPRMSIIRGISIWDEFLKQEMMKAFMIINLRGSAISSKTTVFCVAGDLLTIRSDSK
jgi:hypothetical protein